MSQSQERPLFTVVQEQPINEADVQEPVKSRRGCKPKTVTDTDNPLGRPILARNFLENDTAKDVVLRRSKEINGNKISHCKVYRKFVVIL